MTFEADKVADGSTPLHISVGEDGILRVKYNGTALKLDQVRAAWYRRPRGYEYWLVKYRDSLERNQRLIQNSLWQEIPEERWLNSYQRIATAEHKLSQLKVAKQVGFVIPKTIIANHWTAIEDELPESVVFKLPICQLENSRARQVIATTPYKNPQSLPKKSNPFPGLWQQHLTKAREWRVIVVGDHLFAGAIYTADKAKDDWRWHMLKADDSVRFEKSHFPKTLQRACFNYLKHFNLRYGAFDFVEDHDGTVTFLECNPNGQYGELENFLGFRITEAVADELIRIAEES
ncbi:MAG TPA: hypothetical protein VK694_05890 [Verrucomicrobiae bacterium]|nr:hypothetical protein [Verrucomicrobiae bacterium]